LAEAAPPNVHLILVFDRGYARVELIKDLSRGHQPFLIRAPHKVIVQTRIGGRRRRLSLGRLPHQTNKPVRYRHVLYHSQKAEPVDVIVYRQKELQQAWFLVVPPDSESWLPTEEVVGLYRQRMRIEHCFRDWKSHWGLRGLQLQVQKTERTLRLSMGFTLAYLHLLLLGQDPLAEKLRRAARHGTQKILSALSMAICLLLDPRWEQRVRQRWLQILSRLLAGRGVATLSSFSP
jgi:hypothetical protein